MQAVTTIYKLLSDETRLRMLLLLHQSDLCVCELVGIMDVPQPRISKNISKLRDLGLLDDRRQDKFIQYSLVHHPILTPTLETLMGQLDQYDSLTRDHERLSEKQQYMDSCDVPSFS